MVSDKSWNMFKYSMFFFAWVAPSLAWFSGVELIFLTSEQNRIEKNVTSGWPAGYWANSGE